MPNVTCVKCNRKGSLVKKPTKSKGYSYEYWYVEHWTGTKRTWCYLGKQEDLPQSYKEVLRSETTSDYTQTDTQNIHKLKKLDSGSKMENIRGCRLAWSRL